MVGGGIIRGSGGLSWVWVGFMRGVWIRSIVGRYLFEKMEENGFLGFLFSTYTVVLGVAVRWNEA